MELHPSEQRVRVGKHQLQENTGRSCADKQLTARVLAGRVSHGGAAPV